MDRLDYEKIIDEQITTMLKNNFLDKEMLNDYLLQVKGKLLTMMNCDYKEVVESFLTDYLEEIQKLQKIVPGLSTAIKDNNNGLELYTYNGNVSTSGLLIDEDTKFDLASVTKFFTTTMALKLAEEGKFCLEKNVSDYLGGKYKYLKIPVDQMLRFYYSLKTDGRVDEKDLTLEEINRRMINTKIMKEGTFEYSDIPFIILKDILPQADENFKKYFYDALDMKQTGYAPDGVVTGSLEHSLPIPHDPKARNFRRFNINPGHAGVFSTSKDLVKLFDGLNAGFLSDEMLDKLVTPALNEPYLMEDGHFVYKKTGEIVNINRGLTVCIQHKDGFLGSEVSPMLSPKAFSMIGFTGTYVTFDLDNGITANILTNPLSNMEERCLETNLLEKSGYLSHSEIKIKGRDVKVMNEAGEMENVSYYKLMQPLKEKQIELIFALRLVTDVYDIKENKDLTNKAAPKVHVLRR